MRKKITIYIAGEGGHLAQLNRFTSKIEHFNDILVTDKEDMIVDGFNSVIVLGTPREKTGFKFIIFIRSIISSILIFTKLNFKYSCKIISFGPGVSIVPSIITKLFLGKVVHIETWSRFYTKSMTGKVLYLIANDFYIQNIELKDKYPNAIYSGRL